MGEGWRGDYIDTVRAGGGLKALHGVIPCAETEQMTCGSFCGSCSLLIDAFERHTGERTPIRPDLPLVPADALWSRTRSKGAVSG